MTKDEAMTFMRNGGKVTHRFFSPDEWMIESGYLYEFEDGCMCEFSEFWSFRKDASWDDGWSEYVA